MAVKTFADLRTDMPIDATGGISGTDIRNLTDTVENWVVSLDSRVDTLEASGGGGEVSAADFTTLQGRVTTLETSVTSITAPLSAKTASYTAVTGDDKKRITFNSATAVTFTLPASLPAGWECTILQLGLGQVTVAVTGGALNARGGHTKLFGQYSSGYLVVYANAGSAPQVAFSGDTVI